MIERVYAVGDIHGQLEKLHEVHDAIASDAGAVSYVIVHIGDYTDRGPDSRGVIAYLLDRQSAGASDINLKGNHDRMFMRFMEEPGGRDKRLKAQFGWLSPQLGGAETLASYGVEADDEDPHGAPFHAAMVEAVPQEHLTFLAELNESHEWLGWFFAHAGVAPGVPLYMQDEDDLIWIRDPFLKSKRDHGKTVVHGHTPVREVEDHGNRIAIDTGAAYGGPLSCVVLEDDRARVLNGPVLRG
ncbi:MAG: metallophosphoesterase [Pseudomonadota bacterium]